MGLIASFLTDLLISEYNEITNGSNTDIPTSIEAYYSTWEFSFRCYV